MDWEAARKYCNERNWEWSLELINQAEDEINILTEKIQKLEEKRD